MVEDVVRNSGVKIDSLNKHPEDWRLKYIKKKSELCLIHIKFQFTFHLETVHQDGLHHLTEPRLGLVPNRVTCCLLVYVGRIVD